MDVSCLYQSIRAFYKTVQKLAIGGAKKRDKDDAVKTFNELIHDEYIHDAVDYWKSRLELNVKSGWLLLFDQFLELAEQELTELEKEFTKPSEKRKKLINCSFFSCFCLLICKANEGLIRISVTEYAHFVLLVIRSQAKCDHLVNVYAIDLRYLLFTDTFAGCEHSCKLSSTEWQGLFNHICNQIQQPDQQQFQEWIYWCEVFDSALKCSINQVDIKTIRLFFTVFEKAFDHYGSKTSYRTDPSNASMFLSILVSLIQISQFANRTFLCSFLDKLHDRLVTLFVFSHGAIDGTMVERHKLDNLLQVLNLSIDLHHPLNVKTVESGAIISENWLNNLQRLFSMLRRGLHAVAKQCSIDTKKIVCLTNNLLDLVSKVFIQAFANPTCLSLKTSNNNNLTPSFVSTPHSGTKSGSIINTERSTSWISLINYLKSVEIESVLTPWLQVLKHCFGYFADNFCKDDYMTFFEFIFVVLQRLKKPDVIKIALQCLLVSCENCDFDELLKKYLIRSFPLVLRMFALKPVQSEAFNILQFIIIRCAPVAPVDNMDTELVKLYGIFINEPDRYSCSTLVSFLQCCNFSESKKLAHHEFGQPFPNEKYSFRFSTAHWLLDIFDSGNGDTTTGATRLFHSRLNALSPILYANCLVLLSLYDPSKFASNSGTKRETDVVPFNEASVLFLESSLMYLPSAKALPRQKIQCQLPQIEPQFIIEVAEFILARLVETSNELALAKDKTGDLCVVTMAMISICTVVHHSFSKYIPDSDCWSKLELATHKLFDSLWGSISSCKPNITGYIVNTLCDMLDLLTDAKIPCMTWFWNDRLLETLITFVHTGLFDVPINKSGGLLLSALPSDSKSPSSSQSSISSLRGNKRELDSALDVPSELILLQGRCVKILLRLSTLFASRVIYSKMSLNLLNWYEKHSQTLCHSPFGFTFLYQFLHREVIVQLQPGLLMRLLEVSRKIIHFNLSNQNVHTRYLKWFFKLYTVARESFCSDNQLCRRFLELLGRFRSCTIQKDLAQSNSVRFGIVKCLFEAIKTSPACVDYELSSQSEQNVWSELMYYIGNDNVDSRMFGMVCQYLNQVELSCRKLEEACSNLVSQMKTDYTETQNAFNKCTNNIEEREIYFEMQTKFGFLINLIANKLTSENTIKTTLKVYLKLFAAKSFYVDSLSRKAFTRVASSCGFGESKFLFSNFVGYMFHIWLKLRQHWDEFPGSVLACSTVPELFITFHTDIVAVLISHCIFDRAQDLANMMKVPLKQLIENSLPKICAQVLPNSAQVLCPTVEHSQSLELENAVDASMCCWNFIEKQFRFGELACSVQNQFIEIITFLWWKSYEKPKFSDEIQLSVTCSIISFLVKLLHQDSLTMVFELLGKCAYVKCLLLMRRYLLDELMQLQGINCYHLMLQNVFSSNSLVWESESAQYCSMEITYAVSLFLKRQRLANNTKLLIAGLNTFSTFKIPHFSKVCRSAVFAPVLHECLLLLRNNTIEPELNESVISCITLHFIASTNDCTLGLMCPVTSFPLIPSAIGSLKSFRQEQLSKRKDLNSAEKASVWLINQVNARFWNSAELDWLCSFNDFDLMDEIQAQRLLNKLYGNCLNDLSLTDQSLQIIARLPNVVTSVYANLIDDNNNLQNDCDETIVLDAIQQLLFCERLEVSRLAVQLMKVVATKFDAVKKLIRSNTKYSFLNFFVNQYSDSTVVNFNDDCFEKASAPNFTECSAEMWHCSVYEVFCKLLGNCIFTESLQLFQLHGDVNNSLLVATLSNVLKSTNNEVIEFVANFFRHILSNCLNQFRTGKQTAVLSDVSFTVIKLFRRVQLNAIQKDRNNSIISLHLGIDCQMLIELCTYLNLNYEAIFWSEVMVDGKRSLNDEFCVFNERDSKSILCRCVETKTLTYDGELLLARNVVAIDAIDTVHGLTYTTQSTDTVRRYLMQYENDVSKVLALYNQCSMDDASNERFNQSLESMGLLNIVNHAGENKQNILRTAWKTSTWDDVTLDKRHSQWPVMFDESLVAAIRCLSKEMKSDAVEIVVSMRQLCANKLLDKSKSSELKSVLNQLKVCNDIEAVCTLDGNSLDSLTTSWLTEASNTSDLQLAARCSTLRAISKGPTNYLPSAVRSIVYLTKHKLERARSRKALLLGKQLHKELVELSHQTMNNKDIHTLQFETELEEVKLLWCVGDKIVALDKLSKLTEVMDQLDSQHESLVLAVADSLMLRGRYQAELQTDSTHNSQQFYNVAADWLERLQNYQSDRTNVYLSQAVLNLAKFSDDKYQSLVDYMKSETYLSKLDVQSTMQMQAMRPPSSTVGALPPKMTIAHHRLRLQTSLDQQEIASMHQQRKLLLQAAIENYLKCLCLSDDEELSVFRLISLWFDNIDDVDVNRIMEENVSRVPTYKWLTAWYQIAARITDSETSHGIQFKRAMDTIMDQTCQNHPYHTFYTIYALAKGDSGATGSAEESRKNGAVKLVERLCRSSSRASIFVKLQEVAETYVTIANLAPPGFENIQFVEKYRKVFIDQYVPVPSIFHPIDKSACYQSTQLLTVINFDREISISPTGVSRPKILKCICSDGKRRRQLVKANDDLRQDAVMQQMFRMTNVLLKQNEKQNNYHNPQLAPMRTYHVVPLSPKAGIIEFCENTRSLCDILIGEDRKHGLHKKYYPSGYSGAECMSKMKPPSKNVQSRKQTKDERVEIYRDICEKFRPVFRYFFYENYPVAQSWFLKRDLYTRSVATASMVGYILGIGDRHVHNILLDVQTAEVVHIDFGITFEQGKLLATPEQVPFRLTRDMEDGMGIMGVEGVYRRSCESVLQILRDSTRVLLPILSVLLYDPCSEWMLNKDRIDKVQPTVTPLPIKRKRGAKSADTESVDSSLRSTESKNILAERAIIKLREKLKGKEGNDWYSVIGQVNLVIDQARDEDRLAMLYCGWQPYC